MSDQIDRAAQIISGAMFGLTTESMVLAVARDLDAAGLLASPEHDAAVAARVLRDAADALEADAAGPGHGLGAHDAGIFHAALRLRERADRIEREGGESDA